MEKKDIKQMVQFNLECIEILKKNEDYIFKIKNKIKGTEKMLSGFAAPVIVSDQLYDFLDQFDVKKGEPIARTMVTKLISDYIKKYKLQDQASKREIHLNKTLIDLFGDAIEEPESEKVIINYWKLQKYISQHFPKKAIPKVEEKVEEK